MGRSQVVTQLEKQYKRILAESKAQSRAFNLARLPGDDARSIEASLRSHQPVLDAITTCIRLFDADWEPPILSSKIVAAPNSMPRLLVVRLAYGVLNEAKRPLTTAEILDVLYQEKALTHQQTQNANVRSSLTSTLKRAADKGSIGAKKSSGRRGIYTWWVKRRSA